MTSCQAPGNAAVSGCSWLLRILIAIQTIGDAIQRLRLLPGIHILLRLLHLLIGQLLLLVFLLLLLSGILLKLRAS